MFCYGQRLIVPQRNAVSEGGDEWKRGYTPPPPPPRPPQKPTPNPSPQQPPSESNK